MLTVKDAEEHGIRMFSSDSMVRLVQNHAAKHVEKELAVIEHVDNGACSCHKNIVLIMVEVGDSLQCLVLAKDVKNPQSCISLNSLDVICMLDDIRYAGGKSYLCLLFDEGNLVHNKKSHFLWVELFHPLEPHAGDERLPSPRR